MFFDHLFRYVPPTETTIRTSAISSRSGSSLLFFKPTLIFPRTYSTLGIPDWPWVRTEGTWKLLCLLDDFFDTGNGTFTCLWTGSWMSSTSWSRSPSTVSTSPWTTEYRCFTLSSRRRRTCSTVPRDTVGSLVLHRGLGGHRRSQGWL